MANTKRNARLAKWMGKDPREPCSLYEGSRKLGTGKHPKFCRGPSGDDDGCPHIGWRDGVYTKMTWGECRNSVSWDKPFHPDTDPAAAIELLGWLVAKPREWYAQITFDDVFTHVMLYSKVTSYSKAGRVQARADGPPLTALPAAIAEAAGAVLDLEEGDDG